MKGQKRIAVDKNPEKFIGKAIAIFVQKNPANRRKIDGGRYWDTPLVGFASGEDPLFMEFKKIIGKSRFWEMEVDT